MEALMSTIPNAQTYLFLIYGMMPLQQTNPDNLSSVVRPSCIIMHHFASLFRFFLMHHDIMPRASLSSDSAFHRLSPILLFDQPSMPPSLAPLTPAQNSRPHKMLTPMLGKYSKKHKRFLMEKLAEGLYFNLRAERGMGIEQL